MARLTLISRSYFLWSLIHTLYTAGADTDATTCYAATNCTECLLQGPHCTWCFQADYAITQRCDTVEEHESRGCNSLSVVDPLSETLYSRNESVRNANETRQAIQLSPQEVNVRLFPGRSVKIPITYRIAEDYPVDLYYIMDFSYSMKDDQNKLISLAELLAGELRTISKDVRIGLGAFVDKSVMPFAGVRQESIENPCFPKKICEPMYGFINRLSLTSNISIFGDTVRDTPISGNQDSPEGGFDALLQAMLCDSQIGWRSNSRKIILYSTDAPSHIAADGKLAGIIEPNDGLCHLNQNTYLERYSLNQDFPSISQIASVARNTSTSIIFAISKFTGEYRRISELIPSSVVGLLADDSSNIVSLVKEKYDSLIKTVKLVENGMSNEDEIVVKLKSNCTRQDGQYVENKICNSARIGQEVHFEAEISLKSCAASRRYSIAIKPHDLAESVLLDIEADCECDCEDGQVNIGERCSGLGTYTCGICSCNEGFNGDHCECNSTQNKFTTSCLNPVSNVLCSGHGNCGSCGSCLCDCLPGELEPDCNRYSGEFCECNGNGCHRRNGKICSGQGNCTCDAYSSTSYCECNSGFLSDDCSCPVSDLTCRSHNNTGAVCSDRGSCVCGKCKCTDACYEGATCSIIKPECSRACVSFRECVICKVRPSEGSCSSDGVCQTYNTKLVSEFDIDDNACFHTDLDGCKHYYKYEYVHKDDSWTVTIFNEPQCQKDYWLEVIIGLCVGILLLGILALIIWKIVVTFHDKREFAKFEKESNQAKWRSTNNPIYKPATSTFQNPMYNKPARSESEASDSSKPQDL